MTPPIGPRPAQPVQRDESKLPGAPQKPAEKSPVAIALPPSIPSAQNGAAFPSWYRRFSHSTYWANASFAPEPGRVTTGFEGHPLQRAWQAEQILKSFEKWPPPEGQVYVVQIDQDSPPPPPPRPGTPGLSGNFLSQSENWRKSVAGLQRFVTSYTGQTVVFQARRVMGKLELVELNIGGPFKSASHTSQIQRDWQASCNGNICGLAWLRGGMYPYEAGTSGVFNPVQDSLMEVARDLNGDGSIDRDESIRSSRAHGFAIQIHAGFPGSPRSVGCQTFPPADFASLQRTVAATKAKTFFYVLVRRPNETTGPHPW